MQQALTDVIDEGTFGSQYTPLDMWFQLVHVIRVPRILAMPLDLWFQKPLVLGIDVPVYVNVYINVNIDLTRTLVNGVQVAPSPPPSLTLTLVDKLPQSALAA